MKKKVLAALVVATMAISLVACGGGSETKIKEEKKTESDSSNEESDNEVLTKESSLAGLEEYLLSKGVLSGERTETAAEMVGAVSGFKYVDSSAEFYEYEEDSDAYKKLSAGESIELEGFEGFEVSATAINGKYVLIVSSEGSVDQSLIDAFNSYK